MLGLKIPIKESISNILSLKLSLMYLFTCYSVTDLLLRVFKQAGGFTCTLYAFIRTGRALALVRLADLKPAFREALSRAAKLLDTAPPVTKAIP
jgi:hypothetical protein